MMVLPSRHIKAVIRKIKINLSDLEIAFENGREMISYYYKSYYNEQTQTVDWAAAFQEEHVPEWQGERLQDADRIEAGFGSCFIAIPPEGSYEGYRAMEAFIGTIRNPRLQERLERAISGRGAFRYFKDVLLDHPSERERWFQFKQDRLHLRMLDWLEAQGISPL